MKHLLAIVISPLFLAVHKSLRCLGTSCCPPAKIIHAIDGAGVPSRSTAANPTRFAQRTERTRGAASVSNSRSVEKASRSDIEKIIAESIADAWSGPPKGRMLFESDANCLAARSFTSWKYRMENYWEIQGGHTEAEFARYFHDMTLVDDYWMYDAHSMAPNEDKVIVLRTTQSPPSNDWVVELPEEGTDDVCLAEVEWKGSDIYDAMRNYKGWFVVLTDSDLMEEWTSFFQFLVYMHSCRTCLWGVEEDTGDIMADVFAGLVASGNDHWDSCEPCEAPATTTPPTTTKPGGVSPTTPPPAPTTGVPSPSSASRPTVAVGFVAVGLITVVGLL